MSEGGTERRDEDRNTGSEMPLFQKASFSPKSFYPFEIGYDEAVFSLEARGRESSKNRSEET